MSPFSPRPLFFSSPKVIRSSNNHPPLVTRCLRHAATSHPSTSLTTCQRPLRSFTSTPRRPFAIKTVEAARSRNRSGVSLRSLRSFYCCSDRTANSIFRTAVHFRRGAPLPSCRRRRIPLLPIRKGTVGAPAHSGCGKRRGEAESGRRF